MAKVLEMPLKNLGQNRHHPSGEKPAHDADKHPVKVIKDWRNKIYTAIETKVENCDGWRIS